MASKSKQIVNKECERALNEVITHLEPLGIKELTKEQRQALLHFSKGHDTLAVLPTGHGKTLIYQMAVLVAKEAEVTDQPIVVVVSPLKSLIADQMRECGRFGLESCKLEAANTDSLRSECKFDVLFASAEVFESFAAKSLLQFLSKRIIGIVVDESHCVVKWGIKDDPFRGAYGKIGDLRGFVPCPILCLTATAGKTTRREILKALHMRDAKVIKMSPDRPNCKFVVRKSTGEVESDFKWLLEELKEKKSECPRMVVYCRTIASCGEFYSMFAQVLEDTCNGMFAMYHSKTPEGIQKEVLESLVNPSGLVRVVFATSALGMGVNFPNMRRVIHYGIPRDMEDYVQEVGRGGRDGKAFEALLIYQSYHLAVCEPEMKAYVKNPTKQCRRKLIMESFKEVSHRDSELQGCCDVCDASNDSGNAPVNRGNADTGTSASLPTLSRAVSEEDKELLRDVLLEFNMNKQSGASVFGISGLVNSLDQETVEKILENCYYIFDTEYLLDNFPMLSLELAQEILSIINEVFGDVEEASKHKSSRVEDLDPLMVSVSDWCTQFNDSIDDSESEVLE